MATVTGFNHGITTSGTLSYVTAQLSCGHVGRVELRPERGACMKCGVEQDMRSPSGECRVKCDCGSISFRITYSPHRAATDRRPYREEDMITRLGDEVACETCRFEQEAVAWLRALDRATVQHSRFRHGSYHFYRRDASSPTGVLLIGSVPACPAIEAVLTELRYSPLSPTEPR